MKKFAGTLLYACLLLLPAYGQQKHTLSGYVTDELGEELIGANVFIHGQTRGTITNNYGFFSLTLPEGNYQIECSFIGYANQIVRVRLTEDQILNFSMLESTQQIESVEVYAEGRDVNIRKPEMSTNTLPMKTIQKLPQLLGETDIIKTIQLMPGVLQSNEASGGFHVRGGGVDQNLILLDDATVYNASHAVGFLSVFNADAIKEVKLYKGGMPARYGGRLSSILDIHMKEGNKQEFHGAGGIGTITSRLTVEGPIWPGKASFIVSGRRSYADIFLPFIKDSLAKASDLYLYDLNAKVNLSVGEKDRIFLSGYFGRDVVKLGELISQDYGNTTLTARWSHVFNNRLFFNSTTIYSNYRFDLGMYDDMFDVNWITNIEDYNQRFDFTYYLNPENTLKFGVQGILHTFSPARIIGEVDTVSLDYEIPDIHTREFGIYASNEQDITTWLSIHYGLRYSYFQNVGPGQSIRFDETDPQEYVPLDTVQYEKNDVFNIFNRGWEPRLSVRISTGPTSSVKASYNRMYQYIHLASSSTASLPLDFWFPSSPNIEPQQADQVAAGYFRNFKNDTYEASVEIFYKWYSNSIDFKDRAQLLLNDAYEGELRVGRGWSYGIEFLVRKQTGKLTGWLSYTYARSFKEIPEINQGEPYPANYDKPHDFALVLSYDLTDRINFSGNWIYTSAPPRTMPTSRFEYGGIIAPVYSDRNTVRIFPYHRLDLAVNWRLNKADRKFEHYLNFSVYNVYMRKNPIMINFSQNDDDPLQTDAIMYYLYRIVPSITYSFKF